VYLLDTNVLIWIATGDRRLSPKVRRRLENNGISHCSASVLSLWELGCAVERRRLRFNRTVTQIWHDLLRFGLVEHPVTAEAVIDALALSNLSNDPMDRLIVATARTSGAVLVTSDAAILDWPGRLERIDARS
jgi:PIN domain nuclease of toxin-antitoxin system